MTWKSLLTERGQPKVTIRTWLMLLGSTWPLWHINFYLFCPFHLFLFPPKSVILTFFLFYLSQLHTDINHGIFVNSWMSEPFPIPSNPLADTFSGLISKIKPNEFKLLEKRALKPNTHILKPKSNAHKCKLVLSLMNGFARRPELHSSLTPRKVSSSLNLSTRFPTQKRRQLWNARCPVITVSVLCSADRTHTNTYSAIHRILQCRLWALLLFNVGYTS